MIYVVCAFAIAALIMLTVAWKGLQMQHKVVRVQVIRRRTTQERSEDLWYEVERISEMASKAAAAGSEMRYK